MPFMGACELGRIFSVAFFVRAKKVTRCRSTTDAFDFDFRFKSRKEIPDLLILHSRIRNTSSGQQH